MPDLNEVVVLVPAEEQQDPLDAGLADATAAALKVPGGPAAPPPSAGETLTIEIDVAGEQLRLAIHPLSVKRLVLLRYCAGGWNAVYNLRVAIDTAMREAYHLTSDPNASRLAVSRAAAFVTKTAEAIEFLETLVSAVLLQSAINSLGVARDRIAKVKELLKRQQERYGIKANEKGLDGTDVVPGRDVAYSKFPEVEVPGSRAEADALAQAVQKLASLHRNFIWTRVNVYAPQPELSREASVSGPKPDYAPTPTPDPAGDKLIDEAERAFREYLELIAKPEGHPVAPAVFALLKGSSEVLTFDDISEEQISEKIWSSAFVYLRDTLARIDDLIPDDGDYPFEALEVRLTNVELGALNVVVPPGTLDTPELRAGLWAAQRVSERGYEPFDDEVLLVGLLKEAKGELERAAAAGTPLGALIAYRAIAELIATRDLRDRILALTLKVEQAPLETVNRVAGVLGLVGLFIPAAEIPSIAVGLAATVGSAIVEIRDVERQQRLSDAQGISSLLDSDQLKFAESLVSRPSVALVLVEFVGMVAAFRIAGRIDREGGILLQVLGDLDSIEPFSELEPFLSGQ